ncbi:MAG: glycosyltransferase [Muribaculaceae bacterium]|nr:glycosyltransferase [Muribaculaceae bacterium]
MFSVIIPVYNRADEMEALLESLAAQTAPEGTFEVIAVDDGSSEPCADVCARYPFCTYYWKENQGRSIARNYAMERARGDYFIFFDSDCIIPPGYFQTLLSLSPLPDCFGGPDAAHESFTTLQKGINFAMTSFLTTGGIRGGKVSLEKFTPRTFNMGFSREVYERVGGFREMFSEDIDMSMRIRRAGFAMELIHQTPVYHKRRMSWRKFARQVYVFGMSRITLMTLYPGSLKAVHCLPALFLLGSLASMLMGIFLSPWWLLPLGVYVLALFLSAWVSAGLSVALRAVPAAMIQLWGYGAGFIKALISGRNEAAEIEIRKGKNE